MTSNEKISIRNQGERQDIAHDPVARGPIGVDLFFVGTGADTDLPADIIDNPKLLEQAAKRRELYTNLRGYFSKVPDVRMEAAQAVSQGLVSDQEMDGIYRNLTEFLREDANNGRILLYLPSELLPDYSTLHTPQQSDTRETFRKLYSDAWVRLLFESDIRANFVDGDVLEPGMGAPVRVRKAAHLLPDILEKNIIDARIVVDLLDISREDELLTSLTEGAMAARGRNVIDDYTWRQILALAKEKPIMENVLQSANLHAADGRVKEASLNQLTLQLDDEISEIEKHYADTRLTISPERIRWERGVRIDEAIDRVALSLRDKLLIGTELEAHEIERATVGTTVDMQIAAIRGSMLAGERMQTLRGDSAAREFTKRLSLFFRELWNGSDAVKEAVAVTLRHWEVMGIADTVLSRDLGIRVPDLAAPQAVEPDEFVSTDAEYLSDASRKIASNAELSKYVFPVILAFGSRLKGYAGDGADFDAALFIKPGTPVGMRTEILEQLRLDIPELSGIDKLLEFWMQNVNGRYVLQTEPGDADTLVGAEQIHMVLGGVWAGEQSDVQKLKGDIVAGYLHIKNLKERKTVMRYTYLRQLELDMLQFRLMHKGYRKFYPDRRSEAAPDSDLIDWKSDYWDPGYRRVASLLFLSRVFLPDLS